MTPAAISLNSETGVLQIQADASQRAAIRVVVDSGDATLSVNEYAPNDFAGIRAGLVTPDTQTPFELESVTSIRFTGTNFNDLFSNESIFNSIIIGNAGNDFLYGGDGSDSIYGNDGRDTIEGAPFNSINNLFDTLIGNSGDDMIHGNADNDLLAGGDGDDHVDAAIRLMATQTTTGCTETKGLTGSVATTALIFSTTDNSSFAIPSRSYRRNHNR